MLRALPSPPLAPSSLRLPRRRGRAATALAVAALAALISAACGGAAGDNRPQHPPQALAPATQIPAGLDAALALPPDVDPVAFSYTEVTIGAGNPEPIRLGMFVADTIERRTRGLMFRSALPPDTGMLFAFPTATNSPFWNRDTPLDLDIAFLGTDGVIQEILPLQALDATLVAAEQEYLYALELPAGWFVARGIAPGDRVQIPASVEGFAD